MAKETLRVAAYAVIIDSGRILLARLNGTEGRRWTLPGGGIEHGEDPYHAVIREVAEETGYRVAVDELLGIDSHRRPSAYRRARPRTDFHAVRVLYTAHITGGELRHETGGSTDRAAWFDLRRVPGLTRVSVIDAALALHTARPADGHTVPTT
ncbi:NUDIX hydrolase [Streptomyces pactum]|uniref:NUDIX hydrolase n=1 Tax=Streptomyces pactum TaxID=68249 RepID=A0ABS0NGM0_9ACTN|nr:NUDIX hydrolase [Streptomyces pactum]MBH5334340.1 NUDIX hydrolase [Streptomyces pactum]